MSLLLNQVKIFLERAAKGESGGIPPSLIEDFKEACGEALEKQFNRPNEKRLRMSALGKPLCQQQLDLDPDIEEEIDYTLIMKFIFGDLAEALSIAIMKSSGIEIEEEQKPVSLALNSGKTVIKGTYDVKINGKVYDIKTASPAAFSSKFGSFGGYSKVKEDDPFGYIVQGYLYSTAEDVPFGGWIVINKATGEWAVCEAPDLQDKDRKEALKIADRAVSTVTEKKPFKRGFKDYPEKIKRAGQLVTTKNRLLPKNCSYCVYKKHCWPNASYEKKPSIREDAKAHAWYSKYVSSEL